MAQVSNERDVRLFTTPFEVALRTLFVLEAIAPAAADLRRLVIFDYILLHSGDVDGGPDSVHPATPHRSGELLVKRELMTDALTLLVSRELAIVRFSADGIAYSATEFTGLFIAHISASYARQLRRTSSWIAERFGGIGDDELNAYISQNLDKWGGEFHQESLVREAH